MKHILIRVLLLAAASSAAVAGTASGKDWPQFRGLTAGVAADNPKLPDVWDTSRNVTWSTGIPGVGWSSPIVSGDHVFVTAVASLGEEPVAKPGFYAGREPIKY